MRKYNTLLVTGTTAIRIPIIKRAVVDFAVGADWTPAAGDVKVFVDGAAVANITNLPTAIASGNTAQWEFILTAAELSCKQILVMVADAATKAIEDQSFSVETYGNASAMYAADLSLANLPANVTQWLGTACATPTTSGIPEVDVTHVSGQLQTGGDLWAAINDIDNFVDTEVSAIKTKTDFLPSVTAGAAGGLMIAGSNAATTFATLTVTGDTTFTGNVACSAGITITQSTLNGHGISVTGNGTGSGVNFVGGATGMGANFQGGSTSGLGLRCYGIGAAYAGFLAEGTGAAAHGARFIGGTGTSHAISLEPGAGTGINGDITGNLSGSVNSVTTGVTLAATATSAQLVDDILDEVISEAAHTTANSLGLLIRKIAYILGHTKMNITDATGAIAVRNAADSANVWTGTVSDDSTTTVRTALA